jgi:hypothetical protein
MGLASLEERIRHIVCSLAPTANSLKENGVMISCHRVKFIIMLFGSIFKLACYFAFELISF